jgi:CheY-like chemotaxis protein
MIPLSILLVDDDEDVRTLFELSLKQRGHSVATATCGREAIARLERDHFDVLVTDIIMPEGDGIDVIKAARKSSAPMRIVAMSGGGRYVNGTYCRHLAETLGADASLTKPLRPAELIGSVEGGTRE